MPRPAPRQTQHHPQCTRSSQNLVNFGNSCKQDSNVTLLRNRHTSDTESLCHGTPEPKHLPAPKHPYTNHPHPKHTHTTFPPKPSTSWPNSVWTLPGATGCVLLHIYNTLSPQPYLGGVMSSVFHSSAAETTGLSYMSSLSRTWPLQTRLLI